MAAVETPGTAPQPAGSSLLGLDWFWRVMAGLMVVVMGWVIWVMWQITPHSVVTDSAFQSLQRGRPSPPPGAGAVVAPAATGAAQSGDSPVGSDAPASATADPAAQKAEMLRMATEIQTPIAGRPEK